MSEGPEPTLQVAAVPATVPFVAPEELGRRAGHASLLRLGANESAFGPPPAALEAMAGALDHTAWYGDPESAELRDALARKHRCDPSEILVASGIDDILGLAVRTFLAPGDIALATRGTYPTFGYHVTGFGGRLETVSYDGDGSVPLDALAVRARELEPKIVYLANPDNPSGSFHGREALERFSAGLPPRTLFLLDEAYADFVRPEELIEPAIRSRMLRARTFSKAYGLAGARIAYALASDAVIATFQKVRHHYGVNRTAQIGALAALGGQRFVSEVVAEVERGRAEYAALAARLGIGVLPSRTNFVCFDLETRERAEAMVAELLRRAVFIRKPGAPPLDRYVRVTVGTAEQRERFADAFTASLAALDAHARV